MLQAFLLSAFTISCAASPFHKYPFVFLLDIGNEELGKANTEQIKVSVPGGALAIKYPAAGQGDIIGHVRVTGIDYGTDLKANIVEGGPGYRYVVLVFMGNTGVEYDAVVTIQTLSDGDMDPQKPMSADSGYEEEDRNDSAEETDEAPQSNSVYSEKMNAEFTQSSSNVYRYVENENMEVHSQDIPSNDDENDNDDDDDDDDDDDGGNVVSEINKEQSVDNNLNADNVGDNEEIDTIHTQDSDNGIENQEDTDDTDDNNLKTPYIVSYSKNIPDIDNGQEMKDNSIPNSEVTYKLVMAGPERFYALRPRFYGDVRAFPQVPVPEDRSYIDHSEDDDNRVFQGQNEDSNNNVNDYISPVEY